MHAMMGTKANGGGDDYDAFSRRARRIIRWKRGEPHAIKRRASRWQRRSTRWTLRAETARGERDV